MKTDAKDKKAALSVTDEWLEEYLAKGGKATTDSGRKIDASNVDSFLLEVAGPSDKSTKQEELHKKAVKAGAADTVQDDEAASIKEQQRIDTLRANEEKARQNRVQQQLTKGSKAFRENVANPITDNAGVLVDRVSSASTAGGIGFLLAILIFLLWVVVQVNPQGDTRLKQFWYMLNGRATLQGKIDVVKQGGSTTDNASVAGAAIGAATGLGPDVGTGIVAGIQAVSGLSDFRQYT